MCQTNFFPEMCPACCHEFLRAEDVTEAMERLIVIGNRINRERIPAQFMADGQTLNPQWSARQRILQVFVKGHSQKAWGI